MRGKVVGLVAAVALLASVGIANAKGPVKLTDGQLDKITAGDTQTSATLAAATAQLNTLLAANTQQLNNQLAFFNFFGTFFTTPLTP
jgi:hypothetical protein